MKGQLRQLRDRIAAGESVDHEQIAALCAAARTDPGIIPVEDAAAVIGLMDEITALLTQQQTSILHELAGLRQGRSALQGYSHLRGSHTGQRLRTKV